MGYYFFAMIIQYLTRIEIGKYFHQIEQYLTEALDYADAEYTVDDVFAKLEGGEWGCFGFFSEGRMKGFMCCMVVPYERKVTFRVILFSGVPVCDWALLEPLIIDKARELNCHRIDFFTRDGLAKVVESQFKCKRQYVVMTREVMP